jgi:hypothetical protein
LVRFHGDKARNRKVVVVAVFDAGGGRGVVEVIWVVAVPIFVRVVLEPADVVQVVAVFDAGGGRGVIEGIWVVAVPVVVWNVLNQLMLSGFLLSPSSYLGMKKNDRGERPPPPSTKRGGGARCERWTRGRV